MRPTIGLQITELDSQYAVGLYRGVAEACEQADINLVLFPGRMIKSPYEYDYQYNVIYDYARPGTIDVFIMVTTTLCNYLTARELGTFVRGLQPLPIVSVGFDLPGHSSISIDNVSGMSKLTEHLIGEHGVRRLAFIRGPEKNPEAEARFEAFKEVLGRNRISYLPELVFPGDFTPTLHTLTESFLRGGAQGADAVIAANDEMAVSAMAMLHAANKRIPGDIIVTGFDDIGKARFGSPPLTTVSQPLSKLGRSAVALALELLSGAAPRNVIFPTELTRRASCGCFTSAVDAISTRRPPEARSFAGFSEAQWSPAMAESFLSAASAGPEESALAREFVRVLIGERLEREAFELLLRELNPSDAEQLAAWQSFVTRCHNLLLGIELPGARLVEAQALLQKLRVVIADAMQREQAENRFKMDGLAILVRQFIQRMANIASLEDLMEVVRADLPRLGIRSCHLTLYESPVTHPFGALWDNPANARTLLTFDEYGTVVPESPVLPRVPRGMIVAPELLHAERRKCYVAYPLFSREEQLGVVLFEMENPQGSFYETLCVEIASALKTSILLEARSRAERKLRDALRELRESNEKLALLSYTDELTRLYNRRGFIAFGEQALRIAARMERQGLLFFADVDDLKQINDTYGHPAGDEAIQAAAAILSSTLRSSDIAARIGGDEFAVLTLSSGETEVIGIRERIVAALKVFNADSDRPWQLSLSVGVAPTGDPSKARLEELLAAADTILYEEKRAKHIRER